MKLFCRGVASVNLCYAGKREPDTPGITWDCIAKSEILYFSICEVFRSKKNLLLFTCELCFSNSMVVASFAGNGESYSCYQCKRPTPNCCTACTMPEFKQVMQHNATDEPQKIKVFLV